MMRAAAVDWVMWCSAAIWWRRSRACPRGEVLGEQDADGSVDVAELVQVVGR